MRMYNNIVRQSVYVLPRRARLFLYGAAMHIPGKVITMPEISLSDLSFSRAMGRCSVKG